MAYFADGDYRASKAWVRVVDWMVLMLIAGLEPVRVPQQPMRVILTASLQVTVLIIAAIVFQLTSPFLSEFEWKRVGKLGTLLLSALAVALNAVAALSQDAALQARSGD